MRLSASVLDAVKINKDCAVNVLEAAADKPVAGRQQQGGQQQRKQQLEPQVADLLVSWLSRVDAVCG